MKLLQLTLILGSSIILVGCNQADTTVESDMEASGQAGGGMSGVDTLEIVDSTLNAIDPYTMAQVETHNQPADCWTVVDGQVYDLSAFITDDKHPGGEAIFKACGVDATEYFLGVDKHEENNAAALLPSMQIGTLVEIELSE